MRGARYLAVIVSVVALTALSAVEAGGTPRAGVSPGQILIYGPSLAKKSPVNERVLAEAAGFDVTVVSKATWSAMTTADFSSFQAIVFGDPHCKVSTKRLQPAEHNTAEWSTAVDGNVVVIGSDPVFHGKSQPGAVALMNNGLAFAAAQDGYGQTGLYVALSCYYHNSDPGTRVELLRGFGSFTVRGQGHKPLPGCPDHVTFASPSSPVLKGLSEADIDNWGCTVHEAFDSIPSSFEPVVREVKSDLPFIITST